MDREAWQATVHGINPQRVGHHTHTQFHSHWFHPLGYITFPNCVSKSYHIGDETSTYGFSVQFSRSVVSDSAIPWIAARQVSLSITNSWSLLKLMSIES